MESKDNILASVELVQSTSTMEFTSVCRICLQDGELFSLYEKSDGVELSYSEKIMQVTNINLMKIEQNLPDQICGTCVADLEASYRFKMNCESSDAILQTYIVPSNNSNACSEVSEDDEEEEEEDEDDDMISEAESETEMPVDESDLYNYKSAMYDENGDLIQDEDILQSTLDASSPAEVEEKPPKPKRESTRARAARMKRNQEEKGDDPQKLHICEICGNGYKYRHALEVHMRRHRGEKPYKCEYCDRCFVIRFELKRHMRTHTGQKPYGCRYCERKFSDFGSRIKHERSHTGERPYICQTCGKTFAYSHVLSGHMLTHTGEKRYQCPTCGKRFTKSHHLKSHLNTHMKALNKQGPVVGAITANVQQTKVENDGQDLVDVVQLGFQVISNNDKY